MKHSQYTKLINTTVSHKTIYASLKKLHDPPQKINDKLGLRQQNAQTDERDLG